MKHPTGNNSKISPKVFHQHSDLRQKRERLERIIRQLIPDRNPLINSSMEFYRKQFNFPNPLQSSELDVQLLGKIDTTTYGELLKSTQQMIREREGASSLKEQGMSTTLREEQYGPYSLLFDYYGLYLPMPLDLGKDGNEFQRSIFELKIPMIVKSNDEKPKQQTLHNLRLLNFNFDNSRVGQVINSYRLLLEGQYRKCLESIDSLNRNGGANSFKEDYLLYYIKGLCYFLMEEYGQALHYCEECINLMMNKKKDNIMEKLNGSNPNVPIRLQPIILYVWILFKMFEFSHAEMVLTMCTEEIFPFNSEAHFNMAQFLVGVHGRKASKEIIEKIGNHLKKSLELYMNMSISISNNQAVKNSNLDYHPQNMYNSIFKYFNYYLHFLQVYNYASEGRHLISLTLNFANDVLSNFGIAMKIDLGFAGKVQYHRYNTWKPVLRHPIELAFMLVSAARYLSDTEKDKSYYLYQFASDLELLCYKEFNNPEFCLACYCKICGCLELFSISKEYKLFLNKQV